MTIDLTTYVIPTASWGPWLTDKGALTPGELRLESAGDGVTLAGPLRIRVSVQAHNQFTLFGTSSIARQVRDVYSYTLDIPPGQTWTYPAPSALSTAPPASLTTRRGAAAARTAASARASARAAIATDAVANSALAVARHTVFGSNAGFGVVIRPAGAEQCADPCAVDPCKPVDPCAPKKDCGCGGGCGGGCSCGCHGSSDDLPCDFATGRGAQLGAFFPAACEPCAPGAFVGMPPVKGPSLVVAAARGGTIRTRYFNGMFITKEDLWTDQNNNRVKHALMNRAMGQGVVWGLDVCLDGDVVCVLPGYGVDCCGNDIVISSAYRVPAASLVRDPAAAASIARGKRQRMNLLLEYFECPEEPRPVHGDPCSPDTMSCEMSRIRETARLRLVPPCEVDDSGPIKDFLDEVRKLAGDPVITTPPAVTAAPAPQVPFAVLVDGLDAQGVVGSAQLVPTLSTDPNPIVSADAMGVSNRSLMTRARVTLTAKPGFQFAGGTVVKQSPPGALTPAHTATSIVWEDAVPAAVNEKAVYQLTGWTLQAAGGTLSSATGTPITLTRMPAAGLRMKLHVDVGPTRVDAISVPPPPPRFPCSAEACDPDGKPRFPVPLPWLHADPFKPGEAADPKVLVLAILYAAVVSRIAQSGPALDPNVRAEMEKLTDALNLTAWRLLYENPAAAARGDLVEALRRLFQAWCKGLLYPGPRCECGCDPHGVVIGCAVVEGGRLGGVDPWGGRRWVVHYPLLAYWGKQFGLQPFDAIASKLFDLICCVASLQPSTTGTQILSGTIARAAGPAVRTPIVSVGAASLIFDAPANLGARLSEIGVAVDRQATVSAAEFVNLVLATLNTGPGAAPGGLTRYTVEGVPELTLVAPATAGSPTGSAAGFPPAVDPGGATRVATTVRNAIAARPRRSAVPPLLRGAAEDLTAGLLRHVAPAPATDEGRSVRDTLAGSGLTSVAALLEADPEVLHTDVLRRAQAPGLADVLDTSERQVEATVKAVGDAISKLAAAGRIVSRDDLRRAEVAEALADALKTPLGETIAREILSAAIAGTAGSIP